MSSTQQNLSEYDSDENDNSESTDENSSVIDTSDVAHPKDPNTVDETVTCGCGRSISRRSRSLVDDDSCLFCRGESDE